MTMSNDNTESISAKLRQIADMRMSSVTTDCTIATRFGIKCADVTCSECKRKVLRSIVDEIDAEKRAITERYARQSWMNPADAIAKLATGEIEWAELRQAINRYYLPRPLFEDGEPVYIGAEIDDRKRGKLEVSRICYTDGGFYFNNSRDGSGRRKAKGITYSYGERVGRPKQPVLDADGVPIEEGETVWTTVRHDKFTVASPHGADGTVECVDEAGKSWEILPSDLTHRETDTQERIDKDALKDMYEYWGCAGISCNKCPALVDGKKPRHRYGVDWCYEAITLDLLSRQRELDGRDA